MNEIESKIIRRPDETTTIVKDNKDSTVIVQKPVAIEINTKNNNGLTVSNSSINTTSPDLYINNKKIENGYQMLEQIKEMVEQIKELQDRIDKAIDVLDSYANNEETLCNNIDEAIKVLKGK